MNFIPINKQRAPVKNNMRKRGRQRGRDGIPQQRAGPHVAPLTPELIPVSPPFIELGLTVRGLGDHIETCFFGSVKGRLSSYSFCLKRPFHLVRGTVTDNGPTERR